ncbi:hypothetical protein CEUSTIGMA_g5386.t1 [Chlamydomonas eustigma]|uniref:Uncharacterized protein n=1 Tax=Chlamydomonas eustigma TaxID=1157962 RepID=A0A250X4D7_9CHLO|nr:hypothetical protein CEUSTIGMA_g5386.t1 [Chlamydomonas eustigma]|eukprot:GAX77944.1 hypothetical protein CEUSTIGMA_g5386.t1 [Chlamydomonas eustigma]
MAAVKSLSTTELLLEVLVVREKLAQLSNSTLLGLAVHHVWFMIGEEISLMLDPTLSRVIPELALFHQKSCEHVLSFKDLPGRVCASGAVQLIQSPSSLPVSVHPRDKLSEKDLHLVGDIIYLPVHNKTMRGRGSGCNTLPIAVLELFLTFDDGHAAPLLTADVITFISAALERVHLSVSCVSGCEGTVQGLSNLPQGQSPLPVLNLQETVDTSYDQGQCVKGIRSKVLRETSDEDEYELPPGTASFNSSSPVAVMSMSHYQPYQPPCDSRSYLDGDMSHKLAPLQKEVHHDLNSGSSKDITLSSSHIIMMGAQDETQHVSEIAGYRCSVDSKSAVTPDSLHECLHTASEEVTCQSDRGYADVPSAGDVRNLKRIRSMHFVTLQSNND